MTKITKNLCKFITLMLFNCIVTISGNSSAKAQSAVEIYEKSRAAYAALKSYSDVGVVFTEYKTPDAPMMTEQHVFTTFYRAPRQFFFEFKEDPTAGGEQFVIWCNGGDFQTFWSATRVHEKYERGRGGFAFALAAEPTRYSALLIAPLLFPNSGLYGAVSNLKELRLVGTEIVNGRNCHKIIAEKRDTGRGEETRKTTVWFDVETSLVLKIFEDTPPGLGEGAVSRTTITIEPKANPKIDDSRFNFNPSSSR